MWFQASFEQQLWKGTTDGGSGDSARGTSRSPSWSRLRPGLLGHGRRRPPAGARVDGRPPHGHGCPRGRRGRRSPRPGPVPTPAAPVTSASSTSACPTAPASTCSPTCAPPAGRAWSCCPPPTTPTPCAPRSSPAPRATCSSPPPRSSSPTACAGFSTAASTPTRRSPRCSPPACAARPAAEGVAELSGREIEVLRLVADGQSNKEIGDQLGLSALTVKSHLARIARKLGTGDRAEMVALAMRAGVIR